MTNLLTNADVKRIEKQAGSLAHWWGRSAIQTAMQKIADRDHGGDYAAFLGTPTGEALYNDWMAAPEDRGQREPTTKADSGPSLTPSEREADRLAKSRAADEGVDFYTAYSQILTERPELYERAEVERQRG